jgi:hypothetical protein
MASRTDSFGASLTRFEIHFRLICPNTTQLDEGDRHVD